jgi:hypothetical protein
MKREICALLLLAALAAASYWNIHRADTLTAEIKEHLEFSEKALLANDPKYAAEQLEAALRIWLAARNYTQVFLRHPELDETSDIFFETLKDLRGGEIRALPAEYERLRYHIDSISDMEHLSLGSVF